MLSAERLHKDMLSATEMGDWLQVEQLGIRLLASEGLDARVEVSTCRWVSCAHEHRGRSRDAIPVALRGTRCAEGNWGYVAGDDVIGCYLTLGRGLFENLQYPQALDVYRQLLDFVAARPEHQAHVLPARFSIARCLERCSPAGVRLAEAEYRQLLTADDWQCRLAAGGCLGNMLVEADRNDDAHSVLSDLYLRCPPEFQACPPWCYLLSVMARCLVYRGHAEAALIMADEALDKAPANRSSVLAFAHAVFALASATLHNYAQAEGSLELALEYAEMAPSSDAQRLYREVQIRLKTETV